MSYGPLSLINAELYRIRRQRSNGLLPLIPLSGLVVLAMLTITSYGLTDLNGKSVLTSARALTDTATLVVAMSLGVPILLMAARVAAHDYAYATGRLLLGGGASRVSVLAAKLAATLLVAALGLVLSVVIAGACVLLLSTGIRQHLGELPSIYWREVGLDVAVVAISAAACVALGIATSTVSRSLTAGLTAAMVWFPAENILTGLLAFGLATTHKDVFAKLSSWLLAPNLNHLIQALEPWRSTVEIGARPLGGNGSNPVGPVGAEQCLAVIAAWVVAFLLASVLSVTVRVDVRE
jgi:ABC-2 type transport system permease protein